MFSLRKYILGATSLLLLAAVLSAQNPAATPLPALGSETTQRSGKTFVLVYFEEDFHGKVVRLEVPTELANDAQLKKVGIKNDSIQSMKIPDGVTVMLWDNANYSGKTGTYTGKVPSLGDMKACASSLKATVK